jgi:hypothetical protein
MMMRVAWYQHKRALLGLTAVLAVLAAWLLDQGWAARADHGSVSSTGGAVLPANPSLVVALLFGLIGAFVGAPLLSREYEQGTYRFAWTQGAGRMRWCAGQINLLGGLIVVAAAGTGALAGWATAPYNTARLGHAWVYMELATGPAITAGWALLAFMLGVLAGAVIKRTMPAMAATAVTLILLLGWYRLYTFRVSLRPVRPPWWLTNVVGTGLVIVALLIGAVTLLLVRNRGARTPGRRPEPE